MDYFLGTLAFLEVNGEGSLFVLIVAVYFLLTYNEIMFAKDLCCIICTLM